MYAETRYANRPIIDESKRCVHFGIDQFMWYAEGLDNASVPPEIPRKSAVDFLFPHSERLSSARLTVIGEGISECFAYFASENKIWKVFDYEVYKENKKKFGLGKNPTEGANLNVFTTNIMPFLHQGSIPFGFTRIYEFYLFGSEILEVIANQEENSSKNNLTVRFVPDSREGNPKDILTISRIQDRWGSAQLSL